MTDIQPFVFPSTGQKVRTAVVDGEPLVCHVDVCALLQHSNPSVAIRLVDDEDKLLIDTRETDNDALNRAIPGNARTWFLTEAGFYTLALASQAPGAKRLRRWITHEVLPALRKNGSYSIPLADPLDEIERQTVITMRAVALAKRERVRADIAESLVRELVPSANAWDILATADGDFAAGDAAKILSRDPAINLGERTLLGVLIALGWAYRQRGDRRPRAYQHAVRTGRLTELPQQPVWRSGRRSRSVPQVRVTVKGLLELHRRLGSGRQLALSVADLVGDVPAATGTRPGLDGAAVDVKALPAKGAQR